MRKSFSQFLGLFQDTVAFQLHLHQLNTFFSIAVFHPNLCGLTDIELIKHLKP
jgi:hypothetical protein